MVVIKIARSSAHNKFEEFDKPKRRVQFKSSEDKYKKIMLSQALKKH